MQQCAAKQGESQSNGSLMRAAAWGVWGAGMSSAQLADLAAQECRLTHSNRTVIHTHCAYVLALAHLTSHPGDRKGALTRMRRYVSSCGDPALQAWLRDAETHASIDFTVNIGWVRIAFTNAVQHLCRGSTYEQAIRATLAAGGDTDTNAAIVGALVGAAEGLHAIPQHMLHAMLTCTPNPAHKRPDWLWTARVADKLYRQMRAQAAARQSH